MTTSLATLLEIAAQRGCACGIRPCLVHYAEQQRRSGAGQLKKTTQPEQEEFYAQQGRHDSGGSSREQHSDAGVRGDDRGNRDRPGKAVRKPARGAKR